MNPIGGLAGAAAAVVLCCRVGVAAPDADLARVPVLFVHGSGLDASTWRPLIRYLVQRGYPREYLLAIDLVPNRGGNSRAAERFIAPAVQRLLADARRLAHERAGAAPAKVDIVAHSMGAVSARWYVARLGAENVRRWVSLAGANHGTDSLCAGRGDGPAEMCPAFARPGESEVQLTLNGAPGGMVDETPYGLGRDREGALSVPPTADAAVAYLTLRIEPDRWITPGASALLDGAGGVSLTLPESLPVRETLPGNFLFEAGASHDSLLGHPQVLRFVDAVLN